MSETGAPLPDAYLANEKEPDTLASFETSTYETECMGEGDRDTEEAKALIPVTFTVTGIDPTTLEGD